MTFFEKIGELIHLWENWIPEPNDDVQLEDWCDAAETIMDSFSFTDDEQPYVDRLLDRYEELMRQIVEHKRTVPLAIPSSVSREELDALLGRKQMEQRTPEWYQQMSTVLTASELGSLFGSDRERATLVLSKTVPYPVRNQPLAVPSEYMSAFDWGIRFEPVVKQIYEHRHGVTIKELGRMHHLTDPRCTASPDGLIYTCPRNQRTGHLIEIKCPVTREIDGKVPKDYYAQMQMQLHVTGRPACEYVEAVFSSSYHRMTPKEGPSLYDGYVALIRHATPKQGQDFYYAYSPVNPPSSWSPPLGEEEELVERILWRLYQWNEQTIQRNEEWWSGLQSTMESFWADVEKAKRGEFVVPDSKRAPKVPVAEPCWIRFHKLDETGNQVDL